MTIQITKPEIEALIEQRLQSGKFMDAEDVILQALRASGTVPITAGKQREEAIECLKGFGQHAVSLSAI